MLKLDYTYIDCNKDLVPLLNLIADNEIISLDTEADSMYHYHHKLCLLQFTVAETHWLVDPLAESIDINPLLEAIRNKLIIFHGGDYDMRMLLIHYNYHPNKVYDTMIAGQLLGETKLGLTNLVEKYFGTKLIKTKQTADWTQRPLAEDMKQYAATDTYYLYDLYQIQMKKLKELGRETWAIESNNHLLDCTKDLSSPNKSPWKIRGSSKMNIRELACLKSSWTWRETMAEKWDRPPYKVISPQLLQECVKRVAATSKPEDKNANLPKLPRNFKNDVYDSFIDSLYKPLFESKDSWPKPTAFRAKPTCSPNCELLEKVKTFRDELAKDLGINPTIIANRLQMVNLALKNYDDHNLMNWQFNLLKPALEADS